MAEATIGAPQRENPGKRSPESSATGHTITDWVTHDLRFPTSQTLAGSDAMNPDPDYSAAYLSIGTDAPDGLRGYGFAFTIGRGNDVQLAAIEALRAYVVGRDLDATLADLGGLSRELIGDSQLRWLGPEKGIMHMAIGAVLNALWDLRAKRSGLPLWQLLAQLPTEELLDLIDFRYLSDALSIDEARAILDRGLAGATDRISELVQTGYPGYSTAPGWLGFDDETLVRLIREALDQGFDMIKLKVGADLGSDVRRMQIARETAGEQVRIAIDANQRWDVGQAIDWVQALTPFGPYWIEEPTSPDDVLGHAAIRKGVAPVWVASGEHVQNRIVFKQLLQAGALDVLQIDAARVGGVNENLVILLLAAKFGVPVCPHAGGVGLCELVQHLAMFDFARISGSMEGRAIEYVDELHEHFTDPVVITQGRYAAPTTPGFSSEIVAQTLTDFAYPGGKVWASSTP